MDNMDCYDHYEAIMADFGCTTTSSFIKALSEEDPLDDEDWVPPPKEWVNKLYGFFRLPPPVYEVKPKKKTAKTEPSTSAATDPTTTSTTTTSPIAPTTTSTTAPTSTPGPSTTNPTAPLPTKAKKRKVKVDENGQVIKRPRKKVPKKVVKPLSPVKEESVSSWEASRPSSTSPIPSIGSGPDENLPPVPLRLVAPQKPALPKLSPDSVRLPRPV